MMHARGNPMQQQFYEAATSVKTAAGVAVATAGTGFSTWFKWIPDDIGKLASLMGLILSIVLIVVHVHSAYIRHKKHKRGN